MLKATARFAYRKYVPYEGIVVNYCHDPEFFGPRADEFSQKYKTFNWPNVINGARRYELGQEMEELVEEYKKERRKLTILKLLFCIKFFGNQQKKSERVEEIAAQKVKVTEINEEWAKLQQELEKLEEEKLDTYGKIRFVTKFLREEGFVPKSKTKIDNSNLAGKFEEIWEIGE